MSRKVKELKVSVEQRQELEKIYKSAQNAAVNRRAQMVLLKLQGYRSKEIAAIVGCCEMSVNSWIRRFETEGIPGLNTKEGRGRKPLLKSTDLDIVRAAITAERQSLTRAKLIIEAAKGKALSKSTLTRFLKLITAVTAA